MYNEKGEKVGREGGRHLPLVSDRDYRFLFACFNFAIVFSSSTCTVLPFPLKTAKLIDDFFNSGRAREPGLSSPILNQFAQMGKAQRKERKIREI